MPKDEILDGSTWTDVQPQKEEILDGSTWTEVKKKDVPAPKLESGSEATISSNGQSKSKSTSASTIVSKPNPNNQTSFTVSKENSFGIPNFQIPGVQKNTFKPLTEQQKAAGKKVLGEGTTVVEQQKVKTETPETSAKKSAILKAVTGKDISYDEVSRLSDVSNTDYAGILAAQKEKQKTDNTFATNPALQEEQRQEQVKQSEFLGNREFKVNNPQANVQILEQKNPTLLKDIADKTLELDEQRTAESFNKDKPVSQRFTKPSSDVPYKPFTDYLEVDELATVSPMELYETREKESDREKQLKYFKDRGNNNIFNEYDNEQTAISYKQGELKKKYNTAVNNLKDKYGENWLYGAEQGDKDLADLISAQKGLQENYNLSRDLLKTDKYAEVNKTIQERAQRQAEIDKTAKDDTWYKFTDESNKIQNVVMNTAYGLVNDIASLPRFFNGLSGNNDFNWTDKVADATQRFTDAGMAYFNTPTDVQRDNVQDYAEVDGYRVFLDKKGNPTSLRDADNFMVNNDAKKEEIFTKYSDNKDKIKVKTDWIDGEQIMNQSSKIIGDMLVMIAEGGGIGAGIKGVGKVSRSARLLNLAENAKLTTSLAVISQMQNEMMNDAIDKGMSKEDAAKYSAISSAGVAAISLINPMEAQFLKNIKNVKSLASEEVTSFLNGNTTLADLSKKTIGAVIGNSVPEIAEEQFFEPVLQNVVNDSYKNQVGVNEQLDQTDVLGRENLAQSVLTATTTFLPSALESSKNMNSNSIKMNILENPENWMAIIDKKKELGIIEDDIYSAEVAAMQKAKKKYDALKSEVKQSDRTKLAGLIGDKVAIESKLSDAPELKPKYENQVKEIDSKISNLTNGITEAPKIEQAGAINIQSQDFGAEAKQDAKIESAVIEIGGKIYEGKNHAEAILKAKADGQDISQVNRQAEGKFKLSDGTIIDRAEAKTRFGQDRSELIIPQDEAAKQANKDYAEITKGLKNEQTNQNTPEQQDNGNSTGMAGSEQNSKAVRTKSEQGKLSNEDKIQQNATTEVQKQITEVEKIISELEDNPNSPFHKLVNLDEQKQKLSELQKKEAEVKKESAQPVLPETKAQKAANPRLSFLPKKKVQAPAPKIETTPILDEIKSKNLTQKEKTSLIKDVTDLAKGLIQEGKATLDNVIDKIKEAIKKRFPDLDENDLNDISENIKQKVLFDEAFQWYKDNDYTYEEAKKELDDNDVDYNEKDLKAIFAEKKEKSVNEKRLQNRAFDGTTDEELKSIIEDYGLTYDTESQIIAEEEANDIIEEVGLEKAFQAVLNGYINGAQAAVVYAKMVDHIEAQLKKGNLSDEELVKLKELQAYAIDIFDNAARDAGRFIAMLKRVYHKSLFTYDAMVKSAENAKGTPLTEEERLIIKEQAEKIAEFDKKIKELEAKLDEERAQNAVKNIKALNNKPKTASFKAKAKALADKFRQLKSKPLVLKDADGNPIELTQNSIVSYNDIIELAAKAIEKTGELLDGINTALQEIKKQKWYQNLSQRDKDAVDRQVKEELLNLDTEVSDDKFKIPNSLLREIVRNGTEDIDGIVEKVLEVYGDIYPDLDARKVRDMITKYGESIESKEDLIGGKLALAKRIGRLLSAKEDLLNGKLPKKSGFQREKPGPTERLLMQEIQQLLKNVPKSQEELDALWATALDKAKNRVKNRIEELQLAIDKAEKINKSKNVQNYNDAGLDNLKSQLKEKQAEYDAAFPKEKSTLSDEQRLNQLINSKKKRLAKLEQQKIDKVYEINKKDGPDKSKFPELAKQIADLDAEIKKVNDEIKADETWKAHVEKKRIELAKKANQRRIDELKRRIDEKDFIVKKNPTPIDDELKQLRREKQKVADDYELAKYKYEQENRSPTQKGIDWILDVLTLPKSLKATLDLSAPLRQGATVLLSNPQIFWNSFIKMHGQAISNNIFEKSIDNIKKSDNYDLAQDSGLQITDPNSIDDRKKDDQFSVKLANKIPLFNKLHKGSERAYSGFLNNIRFSLFEQGVKELENAGIKYEDNPKMFKALASTVNNLTGRGKSADGNVGKFLNFILFSPRMITSRVLLLHDLMRTDIPFNSPSRKMAAKSLLGTAVYIVLFNLLGTILSNASDDDDKDRKPNFNPVATDFLKVRSKQTTFDPTAGYAPLIRTAARIATEKSINSSGRETDLSKSYGSTRFTPAFDLLENKLSPTISYLANVATHKNPNNKYENISEAEWYDYVTGLTAPLQAMQVADNFSDKDKFGKDLLEVVLGLYGIGVQQYETTGSGKGDSRSSGKNSDSRGTAR